MTLKDLQLKLWKQSAQQQSASEASGLVSATSRAQDNAVKKRSNVANADICIAKSIVDKLYEHVIKSIKSDRSSVKLNMFEKAAISSGLGRMTPGTKEYLDGMRSDDIKLLLDDILVCYTSEMLEEELDKRCHKKS